MPWLAALTAAGSGCAAPSSIARAQALVRAHDDAAAVSVLRDELKGHPDDVPARRLLVRLLGLSGDIASARVEADALAERLPQDDPSAEIELGHALELAHRYDDALAAYDAASQRSPSNPSGPREGGMRSARWGEADVAAPRLEEAVRRGAKDTETWHTLGLVRLHLGDLPGAEQAYREAVAADPKAADGWLGLATVDVVRGDAQGALDAYGRIMVLRPRFAPGELGRAWALTRLGRYADAEQALDRAEALGAAPANVLRQRQALHNLDAASPH